MKSNSVKPIILTIICVVIMIVIIVLAAILIKDDNTRNFVIIAAIAAAVVIIWNIWSKRKIDQNGKSQNVGSQSNANNQIDDIEQPLETEHTNTTPSHKPVVKERPKNSTGTVCLVGGHYYCIDHPDRSIHIDAGKKFPPCRGADKPHSAIWSMDKPEKVDGMRTGAICVADGQYVCSEHPDRIINMSEGKRFPPCQGDGKGHSAIWVLME